jgi:DtxR family Mn-dependent transcriptional regulator
MQKLSASLEDYLEIICNYADAEKNIRAVDISKELDISRASVSEALKNLADRGYINYGKYETISLTDFGKESAEKVVSKHITLQKFFETFLGLSEIEASINACKIEHVITENAFNKIAEIVNKGAL